MIHFTQIFR